jgi:dihydrodipicolinate reductase
MAPAARRVDADPRAVLAQVVAVQAMFEMMADSFPGAFQGYSMQIVESHQRSKADTSGTARALVPCFQRLGVDIQEVRCPLHPPCAHHTPLGKH